ncbi:CBS domain-containing protein [Mammaliicoccus sciuri]|uniref:CBS domain-containing protein n=1 Tax=Mammaliicoccus sciuri TaxID=1296 RepID=UPI001E3E4A66|nr:CBS domain-containing protein [Mammaliicoccus sciuri]MCD8789301.1 CBS domain-containing protein [Mammaliicoccus sciuri]MEB5568472.1 CBS domain-containing protein [Mammaliicoccus sciuri]
MYLTNIMIPKEKCYIANPKDAIHSALDKLEHHGIDGLPVVADGKYIGMITRYNIFRHYFFKKENVSRDEFIESTKIEEILTLDLHSLNANQVVEESLLNLQDFPILAVVNDEKDFLGIVTRYDVMEQFKSAFGMKQKGIRIAITSLEAEGRIKRLSSIIAKFKLNTISFVTFDETDKMYRRMIIKVEKTNNLDKFIKYLGKNGFKVLDVSEE